jgi:uncharacterized protein (DUF302 family)
MRYSFRTVLDMEYERARSRATEELQKEGFGILTTIDVKETLKKKLGVDFRKYVILGACNPPLAHRSLRAETEVGLLLPCNVIVYEGGPGKAVVAAIDPVAAMAIVGNEELRAVAEEVREKLRRVIENL